MVYLSIAQVYFLIFSIKTLITHLNKRTAVNNFLVLSSNQKLCGQFEMFPFSHSINPENDHKLKSFLQPLGKLSQNL